METPSEKLIRTLKNWVTLREVTQGEVFACSQMKISEDLAEIYHEQHKKFIS